MFFLSFSLSFFFFGAWNVEEGVGGEARANGGCTLHDRSHQPQGQDNLIPVPVLLDLG